MASDEFSLHPLSGRYRNSFAYNTIKDRLPVILTKAIDGMYRHRAEFSKKYGECAEDLKFITSQIARLRHELTTDKPLNLLEDTHYPDLDFWERELVGVEHRLDPDNEASDDERDDVIQRTVSASSKKLTWFTSPWLLIECYMYRRVAEAVVRSSLPFFDVFQLQKEESYWQSQKAIHLITDNLLTACKESADKPKDMQYWKELILLYLKLSLFGNECDLSFDAMSENTKTANPLHGLAAQEKNILVNDSHLILEFMEYELDRTKSVIIILDNCGMELVTDLCLAELLLTAGLTNKVIFYGKSMPWFVSDTTKADFDWTIQTMCSANHMLAAKWEQRLKEGSFEYRDHLFWTLPCVYSRMQEVCPHLFRVLSEEGSLIVFKGDLNYRKLLGDLSWPPTTPFQTALRGFHPAPLISLRVCKADLAAGLTEEALTAVTEACADWMIAGKYALLQSWLD